MRRTASGNEPVVAVIVPARNAAATIARTMSALQRQVVDVAFEVIVVDDGSTDGTAEIVQDSCPSARLIRNPRSLGPGSARNVGVRETAASIFAFTDADCFPTPGWLAEGVRALYDADLVQGRVVPDPMERRTPFDRSLSVERDGGFYQTANLFVRREVFERVGGFRDWSLERPRGPLGDAQRVITWSHTPIGEDALFGWTARRLGARSAFAVTAEVHHAVRPGNLRSAVADRWHWSRDMPGLVRLVPELRQGVCYRHWFFARWSAEFDLAVISAGGAAASRRSWMLAGAAPYLRRLHRDGFVFRDGRGPRWRGVMRAITFSFGSPIVDGATLAGLLVGSAKWRSLVL